MNKTQLTPISANIRENYSSLDGLRAYAAVGNPIQAMDDINVLSVVNLLRNVAFVNKKQVVITTHDRNFYELLKKKYPSYIFNSKFFKFLEKGRIVEDA